ncbi:hypothetical protein B0H15DRAFT_846967 [Mycena belliarum]|uniref:Uncharacterized protein n=1 Tax=Mycena belliarum TaxID=1033014 RepID=A0AAD6XKS2_9AGAR|nr:hypothetical protein B0H15DRAFT_846967 [Mycena belliae]
MTGESSARLSSTPLRRRMHILERASRSFTTADSSTRFGDNETDDMEPLPSPPTSHEFVYEEDEDEEDQGSSAEDGHGSAQAAAPFAEKHQDEHDAYPPPEFHPWYKPSLPVLLALVPPIGNWLTGGDHLKDLLLLLLLVFYLHQLVEVPWTLYHAARPRRIPSSSISGPPPLAAAHAAASLRSIELLLLVLCILSPIIGVVFLRSLASLTSSGTATPLSWFSTTVFALLTGLRPLRELVTRIATRTSTLHAHVHAHTAPPAPHPDTPELDALRARLAALEARLETREDSLYAYVEDAVAPLEKGVRRIERRVGKLRTKDKQPALTHSSNTIFVPAQRTPSLLASWFAPPTPMPPPVPVLASPTRLRRALEPIPEEGEGEALYSKAKMSAKAPAYIQTATYAYAAPAPPALLPLIAQRCTALALWPLWALLVPVRGALRFLVGVV